MLYSESATPFKVAPIPSKIVLSAVRSKTLYLFEFRHYMALSGCKPSETSELRTLKIVSQKSSTPENLVPYYMEDEDLDKLVNTQQCKSKEPANVYKYFITDSNAQTSDLLSQRLAHIKEEESKFIKMLGLQPTE